MPSRKSQSISINTIIVAAIALAVLVVLFVIFTGRLGTFSKGVGETASCANSCKSLGMEATGGASSKEDCERIQANVYVPGTYSELGELKCCCRKAP